jgi:hypothetical protein
MHTNIFVERNDFPFNSSADALFRPIHNDRAVLAAKVPPRNTHRSAFFRRAPAGTLRAGALSEPVHSAGIFATRARPAIIR